ncbi:MAG: C40 family peptidase [Alcaligenaceae bacterium]|nr:C40 family peptidase [Alcaligenaceae bacterium]
MPPPHRTRLPGFLFSCIRHHASRLIVCASVVLLAGCATQQNNYAGTDSSALHALRDSYLSQTQSDPLGAYLANTDDSLAIDYPSSMAGGFSIAHLPPKKTIAGTALKFLGTDYRFGGDSPSEGFDCSGLVFYAAEKSLGLKLPRTARAMASSGESVKRDDLRRGDLVFFNTRGHRFSHVGIYLGDHKFLHAPRTGAKVRIESMNVTYWRKRYNGARRLHAHNTTR